MEKTEKFQCHQCQKFFKNSWFLNRHLSRKKPCLKTGKNEKNNHGAEEKAVLGGVPKTAFQFFPKKFNQDF